MILIIDTILLIFTLGFCIPSFVLFIECIAALLPERRQSPEWVDGQMPQPKVAILVPAHNEAQDIRATLDTLTSQLRENDRLIVIADNCTDDTATIACEAGATVIERQDLDHRGKGYALDYGIRSIEGDPPDVVVIIDADCQVSPGSIMHLTYQTVALGRPVQAIYLMTYPPDPTPKDLISALAVMVKNLVRLRGLDRLGLPCLLVGTGMSFPWSVIRKASLASGNIVEDMQLAIDLAIVGHPPVFCPDSKVTGILPQQRQAAKRQRTRWEHGHLKTLLTQVPRLLHAWWCQKHFYLLAMALDLCVPPLSLLVLLWLASMGVVLAGVGLGASWTAVFGLAVAGLLILVGIVSAWARFGQADIPAKALLAIPFYILWKIPLYLTFMLRPETRWIRTERDSMKH